MRPAAGTLWLLLLLAPGAAGQGVGQDVGEVLKVRGPVEVQRGEHFFPLYEHDSVYLGDRIRTDRRGEALFKMHFTGDGELWLGAETRIEVLRPESQRHCGGLPVVAVVSIVEKGLFEIVHDKDRGHDVVEVHTPSAVVCLLGTRVVVEFGRNGVTRVGVREGAAEVRSAGAPDRPGRILHADLATVVEKGKAPGLPYAFRARALRDRIGAAPLGDLGLVPLDSPLLDRLDPSGVGVRGGG